MSTKARRVTSLTFVLKAESRVKTREKGLRIGPSIILPQEYLCVKPASSFGRGPFTAQCQALYAIENQGIFVQRLLLSSAPGVGWPLAVQDSASI
jgi:hypothetical protein